MPPTLINDTLTRIFGGEHKAVLGRLDSASRNFPKGVSFIAVLEKNA